MSTKKEVYKNILDSKQVKHNQHLWHNGDSHKQLFQPFPRFLHKKQISRLRWGAYNGTEEGFKSKNEKLVILHTVQILMFVFKIKIR